MIIIISHQPEEKEKIPYSIIEYIIDHHFITPDHPVSNNEKIVMTRSVLAAVFLLAMTGAQGFCPLVVSNNNEKSLTRCDAVADSRRSFLSTTGAAVAAATVWGTGNIEPAEAVGPVKIMMKPKTYVARTCPPSRPIPGQKAMAGMRGLCVTVEAELEESPTKDLEKVGVYGFITDADTGECTNE